MLSDTLQLIYACKPVMVTEELQLLFLFISASVFILWYDKTEKWFSHLRIWNIENFDLFCCGRNKFTDVRSTTQHSSSIKIQNNEQHPSWYFYELDVQHGHGASYFLF